MSDAGEITRLPNFEIEAEAGGMVAGIDEVGRGCICGFVAAAAVIFPRGVPDALAALLDDSKRLTARKRERAFEALQAARKDGIALVGIGAASAGEIGTLNILRATHLAMARALARLPIRPSLALVDGNQPPPLPCPVRCVIGGDALSLSIAAASIVAKVTRDRGLAKLDDRWPGYGLAKNAGYPSPIHLTAIRAIGVTPHHRRGFAPVDEALKSGAPKLTRRC